MSDLLNKASLVVIPSGYKEDTVYSVVPSDGAGDLSFTRASNGTRINSAGLVEVCPWNLLEQSEDFSNAYWGKTNLSVSANSTTAPNGTTTADTLTTTAIGQCQLITYFDFLVGNYTLSFYIKKVDLGFTYVELGNAYCWVNLTTGAITGASQFGSGWTFVSANASSVGDGWFKVEMVASCSIAGTYGVRPLQPVASSGGYDSLATNKATYLWGAQLNIGSTAKPYFPTTDRLNVPRLTYQNGGGGCPSLLLEKQSTNYVKYSEDFTQSDWQKSGATITANSIISPDGTQNATRVQFSAGSRYVYQTISGVPAGSVTISCYIKGASVQNIGFSDGNANPNQITLTTEWQRYTFTFTYSSGGIGIQFDNYFGVMPNQESKDFYIWGAQLEQSSYATSLINTTSSSATRVADLSTSDTIQTAQTFAGDFTIFADFVPFIDSTDANGLMILGGGASGLGTTYRSYLWFVGSNVYLSGDGEVNIIQRGYSMVVNQRVKIALTRVGTTVKMFVNGAQVGASATSSLSITIRSIGWSYNLPTYQTKGKINQVVLSATGFSDADCQSLTTI